MIKRLLEKQSDLSINQIAKKIKSNWITANNNLEFMKSIGLVEELPTKDKNREGRRIRIIGK